MQPPFSTPSDPVSSGGAFPEADYRQWLDQLQTITWSRLQAQTELRFMLEKATGLSWEIIRSDGRMHHLQTEEWQAALRQVGAWVQRRLTERVPVQYLLQEAWFYGLPFRVTPGVLIPRPETEHLVEAALAAVRGVADRIATEHDHSASTVPNARPVRVLDLGTGSGAIILSLAAALRQEHPLLACTFTATDIDPTALAVAQENALRLGHNTAIETAIEWVLGDWLDALPGRQFDVIVSNPPYIAPALIDTLAPEVRHHEPARALFAQEEGYACYRCLAQQAALSLADGGFLLLELGDGMVDSVAELLAEAGFSRLKTVTDYTGMVRVLQGQFLA
ncbi:MAG: peptide chain release factor N(5)-glutamine methyltransferase [Candidatus Melainabacteria bacterium]|nr:peptide chain release factor N(5)-glutamine methyltransferase [Candidatus Melainabacteria bacterium]